MRRLKLSGRVSGWPMSPYSPMSAAEKSMADEIMTLKEVAEHLRVAEKTAYRLVAEGKLSGFKVGARVAFPPS